MADSSTASKESSKEEKAAAKTNSGIPKAEFVVRLLISTALWNCSTKFLNNAHLHVVSHSRKM